MSKDLEEFLRQAAEMRQRKMAQKRADADQQEQDARSRSRPYTDARQERVIDNGPGYYDDFDEDVLDERDVEILDAVHILEDDQNNRSNASVTNTSSSTRATMPEAQIVDPQHGGAQPAKANPADSLRDMIRRPDGLRQAFMIREILNRPRY